MKTYPEYKDSGVEWIGEVPSHWEVLRLRHVFEENALQNTDLSQTQQLQFNYGEIVPKRNQEVNADVKKIISKYTIVLPNDVVINGLNLNYDFISQRIAQVKEAGIITSAYVCLRPKSDVSSNYYTYFFKGMDAQKMFHGFGRGVRLTLSYEEVKNKFLPIPPISEQRAMAAYLDRVTGEIDRAIARQRRMISLLTERKQIIIQQAVTHGLNPKATMKPSGMVWIGDVPEHWKIKRLKQCCRAFGRIGFRGYSTSDLVEEGHGAITISPSNMKDFTMNYSKVQYLSWAKYYESPEIMIFPGDILYVKTGSTYGKTVQVDSIPMECTINPQISVLKDFSEESRFIAYVLYSNIGKAWSNISVIGGTIPTIAQEKILNYKFALPPISEQRQIITYLDDSMERINKSIEHYQKLIDLLTERKQIIVSEVVTGRIKVS